MPDMREASAGPDYFEVLDEGLLLCILEYVSEDETALARSMAVCRRWRAAVVAGRLWRRCFERSFPDFDLTSIASLDCASTLSSLSQPSSSASTSSSSFSDKRLELDSELWNELWRESVLTSISPNSCVVAALAASSTDNFPDESIEHTLEPLPYRALPRGGLLPQPSYWSSTGTQDPNVPETLTYELEHRVTVVHEVRVQPFKASFQAGDPVYAPKAVRFRLGYRADDDPEQKKSPSLERAPKADEFVWTYTSPVFEVLQEDILQPFFLPRQVICFGGIFQIELIGRVQLQNFDQLYYICICHVKVVGCGLPNFSFTLKEGSKVAVVRTKRMSQAPESAEHRARQKACFLEMMPQNAEKGAEDEEDETEKEQESEVASSDCRRCHGR